LFIIFIIVTRTKLGVDNGLMKMNTNSNVMNLNLKIAVEKEMNKLKCC